MRNALMLLTILSFVRCKNDTVRLQESIEGSWKLEQIVFSAIQGSSADSIVTYSSSGFSFRPGKAQYANEVVYSVGTAPSLRATYVAELDNRVFFNQPCCDVDWAQVSFMPNGNFQPDFSSEDRVVLSGPAYLVNQPGKPVREVQIFLRRSGL